MPGPVPSDLQHLVLTINTESLLTNITHILQMRKLRLREIERVPMFTQPASGTVPSGLRSGWLSGSHAHGLASWAGGLYNGGKKKKSWFLSFTGLFLFAFGIFPIQAASKFSGHTGTPEVYQILIRLIRRDYIFPVHNGWVSQLLSYL